MIFLTKYFQLFEDGVGPVEWNSLDKNSETYGVEKSTRPLWESGKTYQECREKPVVNVEIDRFYNECWEQ